MRRMMNRFFSQEINHQPSTRHQVTTGRLNVPNPSREVEVKTCAEFSDNTPTTFDHHIQPEPRRLFTERNADSFTSPGHSPVSFANSPSMVGARNAEAHSETNVERFSSPARPPAQAMTLDQKMNRVIETTLDIWSDYKSQFEQYTDKMDSIVADFEDNFDAFSLGEAKELANQGLFVTAKIKALSMDWYVVSSTIRSQISTLRAEVEKEGNEAINEKYQDLLKTISKFETAIASPAESQSRLYELFDRLEAQGTNVGLEPIVDGPTRSKELYDVLETIR